MADLISLSALTLAPSICQARLTLETGVVVSTTDQTAKTSVFLTPYQGNRLALYDGTNWKMYALTADATLALGTLTSAKHYDVFGFDSSGNVALEFSAAWTNDTTRATALVAQDGILVKSGAATRRYLGTLRTTSTTTTEDSAANGYLFNYYNQVPRKALLNDAGSHVINNTALREYNNTTTLRLNFVIGIVEKTVMQSISIDMQYGATAGNALFFTNLNGTTGQRAQWYMAAQATGHGGTVNATDVWTPILGLNYVTVSEQEAASQACTVGAVGRNRANIWR
jgi:hypothetical protein